MGLVAVAAQDDLDVAGLAEAFKARDMAANEGKGFSESADSGTLGWSQGSIMMSYGHLWEATEDPYWLGRISENFKRIMNTASDPEGDGFLSWYTTSYSSAVAWAERLHNVSDARIEPAHQKNRTGKEAALCGGHVYLIDFHQSAERFRVLDWSTRTVVADGLEHDGTETNVTQIQPFSFRITGPTHQGDRFIVRTLAPEPLRFVVHQGRFLHPVACFVEAVKSRPELQERFGADAETFLAFINRNVFEKNERDWLDMGEAGGAYRFEPKLTDRFPNLIMPHNQYAEIARVWLVLKDVEGANPLMARRAEQMARYFRSHLKLDEERNTYTWQYLNAMQYGEPYSMGTAETTNYANLDVGLAVEAAPRGVVFTDEDMRRFVNTWLRVMWNQDEENPMMASAVDGRKPYRFSPLQDGMAQLAQWDIKVYELALKAFLAGDENARVGWGPAILLAAKRAGVELPGLASPR